MHRPLTGKVVIATHNAGKLREMRELLAPFGVEAVSAGELDLPVPDETGHMFAENAAIKARAAARATGLPAISDDSGLCVDALDGAPGLFTADWAGPSKDFPAAMARVERELQKRDVRDGWQSPRTFRVRPDRRLARWARGAVRRAGFRKRRLAAPWRQGLRLRPDVPARWFRTNVRRTERRREAWDRLVEAPARGAVASRAGIPEARRRLPARRLNAKRGA